MQEQPKVEGSTSSKHESSVQSADETMSQDEHLVEHDRWMRWMKIGVASTLLVSALALALTAFFTTKENEDDEFEHQVRYNISWEDVSLEDVQLTSFVSLRKYVPHSSTSLRVK